MKLSQIKQLKTAALFASEPPGPDRVSAQRSLAPKTGAGRSPESRALATMIPARPVAISAAQAASERQRRVLQRPAPRPLATPAAEAAVPATYGALSGRNEAMPSVEALRNRWLAQA